MPLPLLAAVPAILAAAAPWITRFFIAKGVLMLAGFGARLGIVIATNELVFEPLLQHLMNAWGSMPAAMSCWLNLFGATKVASILVSGFTLLAFKQLFFAKAAP